MRPNFSRLFLAAVMLVTPVALLHANISPALACNCTQVAPMDGGGGGGRGGPPPGFMYIPDQTQGAVTSISGDPFDGFGFTFDNPYGSASYEYTYTLYDSSGRALTSVTVSGNLLIGPSGNVWFDVPTQYQGSMNAIGITLTVYSPDSTPTNMLASPGNAHAHAP